MFNEDDTFNKLRRIPYLDAIDILTRVCKNSGSDPPDDIIDNELRKTGWTFSALIDESKKIYLEVENGNN